MENITLIDATYDGKKYVRTTLTHNDGLMVQARIDLRTGEIKPYQYNTYDRVVVQRKPDCADIVPHWMDCIYEDTTDSDGMPVKASRKVKSVQNPYYGKLDSFMAYWNEDLSLDTILHDLPEMDNYFTCVAHLGDSNPIALSVLLSMLRDLPEIESKAIQRATGASERHCRRLAEALRLLIKLKPTCERFATGEYSQEWIE